MATIPERLAALETKQSEMSDDLSKVVTSTENIEKTLNELIGAKKALMLVTGFVATSIGLFISWLGLNKH